MRNFNTMPEKEYKEYMRHYNAAANAFDKIINSTLEIDNVKLNFMRSKHTIETDKTITETYRAERVSSLRKDTAQRLASIWSVIENILPSLAEELENIAEGIDLNDARLTAAVALASAPGASGASIKAQIALVEPFYGSHDALSMLRTVAHASNMHVSVNAIDEGLRDIERAEAFIDKAEYFMRAGTYTPDGDFVWFDLAPFAASVAKVHNFTMPETSEEVYTAANRMAMGLPVV